jgi:hypothetical protein
MGSQEMERLEPIIAEDRESRPPCCVSTHRSHVVDICISPTFLDHREAARFYNTPRVFCKRAGGHLAWLPLPYSTLYMSSGSRRERHHADSHLTDLDHTSYRPPSTACAGLHELSAFSDGGDAETFPGRSRHCSADSEIAIDRVDDRFYTTGPNLLLLRGAHHVRTG